MPLKMMKYNSKKSPQKQGSDGFTKQLNDMMTKEENELGQEDVINLINSM